MLASLEAVVSRAQKKAKDKNSNQVIALLAMAPAVESAPQPGIELDCPEADLPEMPDEDKLRAEKGSGFLSYKPSAAALCA